MEKPSFSAKKRQGSLSEFGFSKKNKTQNSLDTPNSINSGPDIVTSESTVETNSTQDIAFYALKSTLSDSERYKVLTNLWNPCEQFVFPKTTFGKKNRSFQLSWLKEYKWLCYSETIDAAFCKICVAFSNDSVGQGNNNSKHALFSNGFKRWKSAKDTLNSHQENKYHQDSSIYSENFVLTFSGKAKSIVDVIQSHKAAEIEANRSALSSIIKTIVLFGRQNISLRGHSDEGRLPLEDPGFNDGNFRALLRFRVESGDVHLENHIKSAPSNAMYTSAPIQNLLIGICGNVILKNIVQRINNAKCFSVLADETTDVSTIEQLNICARYVYEEGGLEIVREDFLAFVPVLNLTGEGLADSILQNLNLLGVDLNFMRGQSYDGASSMSSNVKGVQARILEKYPTAVYTYCASHCLNLVITDASSIQPIRNMLGIVKEVNKFFSKSPLRTAALKKIIQLSNISGKFTGLISLCETRWVERHDSIIRFLTLYDLLLDAIQEIEKNTHDADTKSKSKYLTKCLLSFELLISLKCAVFLLSLSLRLSVELQSKEADVLLCYERVSEITAEIRRIRNKSESEFKVIFAESIKLAENAGVTVKVPRTCGKQKNRANYDSVDAESYYRNAVFVPFVDEFLCSLTTRFENHASNVCGLLNILPKYVKTITNEELKDLYDFYSSDLSGTNESFNGEFRLWKAKWSSAKPQDCAISVTETLWSCDKNFYPNVFKLLKILATLPVTTATSERSFSCLRRLKTYLRNSMSEDRLNGLAIMHIYPEILVPVDEVLLEFKRSGKHRILL